LPSDLDGGGVTAAGFFVEEDPNDVGGAPALRLGGGNDIADVAAHVGRAPSAQPARFDERPVDHGDGCASVLLGWRPMWCQAAVPGCNECDSDAWVVGTVGVVRIDSRSAIVVPGIC